MDGDILCQRGRQAAAAIARYWTATPFVRPGDTVVDFGCGAGGGTAILAAGTPCRSVLGIDAEATAIGYAAATTGVAYPHCSFRDRGIEALAAVDADSVDLVTAFADASPALDAELQRIVKPAGRVLFAGTDWQRLLERAESFDVEWGLALDHGSDAQPRRAVHFEGDRAPDVVADEWVLCALRSPLGAAGAPYSETTFPRPVEGCHVADFREFDNPWLVKGMVAIGMRSTDPAGLARMADRVVDEARAESADRGAALCVLAYQLLERDSSSDDELAAMARQLLDYGDQAAATPTPSAGRSRAPTSPGDC